MLGTERFIAVAISRVRIVPEEPTRVRATIRATFSRANPAAAAESPVKAFSSEITTGMSAPPIGRTTSRPRIAAAIRIDDEEQPARAVSLLIDDDDAASDDQPISRTALITCWPGTASGSGRDQVLELGEGDVRAPEGDRADDRREQGRDQLVQRRRAAAG